MKKTILICLAIFSAHTHAELSPYPPYCNTPKLGPTTEALCTESAELAEIANRSFIAATIKAEQHVQWIRLQSVRSDFNFEYRLCSLKNTQSEVSNCLNPVLRNVIDKLRPVDISGYSSFYLDEANKRNKLAIDTARDTFEKCVFEQATQLDDGISTARDIALAIGSVCTPQAAALSETISNNVTNSLFNTYLRKPQDKKADIESLIDPDKLTPLVIQNRALSRMKAQAKQKNK